MISLSCFSASTNVRLDNGYLDSDFCRSIQVARKVSLRQEYEKAWQNLRVMASKCSCVYRSQVPVLLAATVILLPLPEEGL